MDVKYRIRHFCTKPSDSLYMCLNNLKYIPPISIDCLNQTIDAHYGLLHQPNTQKPYLQLTPESPDERPLQAKGVITSTSLHDNKTRLHFLLTKGSTHEILSRGLHQDPDQLYTITPTIDLTNVKRVIKGLNSVADWYQKLEQIEDEASRLEILNLFFGVTNDIYPLTNKENINMDNIVQFPNMELNERQLQIADIVLNRRRQLAIFEGMYNYLIKYSN